MALQERALLLPLAVRSRRLFLHRPRLQARGVAGVAAQAEEAGVGVAEDGNLPLYRVAIFWTRNGSPRGHFALFFALQ
jgi:hypothetical protein